MWDREVVERQGQCCVVPLWIWQPSGAHLNPQNSNHENLKCLNGCTQSVTSSGSRLMHHNDVSLLLWWPVGSKIQMCTAVCDRVWAWKVVLPIPNSKCHVHLTYSEVRRLHKPNTRFSVISAVVWTCGKLWILALKLQPHDKCNCLKSSISHFLRHSLLHMWTHTHIHVSMCTCINTHHICHMHNCTQSLRAMPHSSNRPANLSQGVSVCDSDCVCLCACACVCTCVRVCVSSSGNVTERRGAGWRGRNQNRKERADRPG